MLTQLLELKYLLVWLVLLCVLVGILTYIYIKYNQIIEFNPDTMVLTKQTDSTNLPDLTNPNSPIPKNIFQTWETTELPENIQSNIDFIKKSNPGFVHYLFDNNARREFIQKYFTEDVSKSYDTLIPGAYRADLWRYCVLYIYGGIYLDIKFKPINGFTFDLLTNTNKEYFPKDLDSSGGGIFNGLLITKPKNPILALAIKHIIHNCKTKFYGESCLEPTGPNMFKKIVDKQFITNAELCLGVIQDKAKLAGSAGLAESVELANPNPNPEELAIHYKTQPILLWDKSLYSTTKSLAPS